MDRLISEKEVLNVINRYGTDELRIKAIKAIPSAEPYKGMTNGDVIQALFPNGKVIEREEATGYEQMLDDKYSYCSWFDGLWWNSPYSEGSEDD